MPSRSVKKTVTVSVAGPAPSGVSSDGNSEAKPSITSWKTCSGQTSPLSRWAPRSRIWRPGKSSSATMPAVERESSTCPP